MTRKQKRPIALLAALTMVISMVLNFPSGCFGITASAVTAEVPTKMFLGTSKISNPKVPTSSTDNWSGSYVYFGNYSRLNSTITDKWLKYRVLSNSTSDLTGKNCMLLESAYVFYDHNGGKYALERPDEIAYYLNTDFYDNCYPDWRDRLVIPYTKKTSKAATDGDNYSTFGFSTLYNSATFGSEYYNKLFLLDVVEMRNSSYGYYNNSTNASNNQLARPKFINRGELANGQATRNLQDEKFVLSNCFGTFITTDDIAYRTDYSPLGFCPALNIESGKVIFSHLVSGTAGEPNAEYSLTIRDAAITLGLQQSKRAYKDTSSGTTKVVVPYYCSTKSPDSKVDSYVDRYSVLITDKSLTSSGANILHYKKIKDANLDTEQEESGELIFDLPDGLPESYKLYILAENVSGKSSKDTKYAQYYEIPQVYDEPMNVIDNIKVSLDFDDLTKELGDQITCLTPQVNFWQVISKVDGNSREFRYLVSNRQNLIRCRLNISEDGYVMGDSPTVTVVNTPDNVTDITAWYEGSSYKTVYIQLTTGKFDPKVTCPFKFTKPSNLVCDGTPKEAIVEPSEYKMDDVKGMGDITVKYYKKDGVQLDSPPIAPGEYVVKIDVTEGPDFLAATDIITSNKYYPWTFSITGNSYAEEDFTFTPPSDLEYDGQPKRASISINDTVVGGGSITAIKYYKEGSTVPLTDAPTDTGKYIVKADVSGGERYYSETDLTYPDWNFTITRGTLKAEDFDFTPPDTEYNGTEKTASVVPKSGVTGVGNVSVKYYLDDNEADPIEVGSYKVKISAEQGTNYFAADLENESWTFDITQKPVTVTADDMSKQFGDSDPVLTYTVEPELISGDSFSGELTRDPGETVGKYDINRGTLDNSNYDITYIGGEFTIVKAPANVTAPTAANTLVYGQTLADAGLTDGWIWEDEDIVPDVNNTGYTAYKEVTDYDSFDYTQLTDFDYDEETHILSYTVNVTVNMATPSVTDPTAKTDLVYTGMVQELITAGSTDFGTMVYSLTEDGEYSAAIPNGTNAGIYTVYYKVKGNENVNDSAVQTVSVSIGKAPVTITANSYTVKIGNRLPTFDYEVSGLVNDEDLPITVSVSCSAANSDNLGIYPIIVSGDEESTNYTFDYVNGTLVIRLKDIQTITSDDVTLTYGETDKTITAATDGDGAISYEVKTGDDVITVAADGTITALKAGTATVEITAAETDEYAKAAKTITVTVNKATPAITVTASPTSDIAGKTITVTAQSENPDNSTLTDVPTPTLTYKVGESGTATAFTDSFVIPEDTPIGTVITVTAATAENENYYAETATAEVIVSDCEHTDVPTEWEKDETDHWHICNYCSAVVDKAEHTYGSWKITVPATADANGKKERSCTVCGYVQEGTVIYGGDESTGDMENATDPDDNACHADLELTDEEIIEKIPLTPEELEAIENGADLEVYMVVIDYSGNVPSADKALAEAVLTSNMQIGMYIDVTLFVKVGDNDPRAVTNTNGDLKITFEMPEKLINSDKNVTRQYSIIRVHSGEAAILDCAYDNATGKGSFKTDKFSSYAIAYKDIEEEEPAPDPEPEPEKVIYYPVITSGNVVADKSYAAAGQTVNVKASFGYDIIVTAENGRQIAKITEKGSFTMPASKVYVTAVQNETFALMSTAWNQSYVYSYDADMNKIKVNSTKKRGVIVIDLGEEYAGRTFTIYSGRKSTKIKVTEGEFDENGKFVFEVPDGKNYTLIVED